MRAILQNPSGDTTWPTKCRRMTPGGWRPPIRPCRSPVLSWVSNATSMRPVAPGASGSRGHVLGTVHPHEWRHLQSRIVRTFVDEGERVVYDVSFADRSEGHRGVFEGEHWTFRLGVRGRTCSGRHDNHVGAHRVVRLAAIHTATARSTPNDVKPFMSCSMSPRPTLMSPASFNLVKVGRMPLMNPWLLGVL